jgi:hypothetical protein
MLPMQCRSEAKSEYVSAVQVCGLRQMGIGLADGGNMLEGLRAVLLRGTKGGKARGIVEHSMHRVAYLRH